MSERIRKGDGVRARDPVNACHVSNSHYTTKCPPWAGLVGRVEKVWDDATAAVWFRNPTDPRLVEKIETRVPLADLKLLAISQSIPQNMWTPALDDAYRMVRDAEAKAGERDG